MKRSRRPAPKRLGEKLLQIRMALGLSQTGIVKKLDYQESPLYAAQISNFERNKREPPVMLILAYARAVEIGMEYLVDDKLDLPTKLSNVHKSEGVRRLHLIREPNPKEEGKVAQGRRKKSSKK